METLLSPLDSTGYKLGEYFSNEGTEMKAHST